MRYIGLSEPCDLACALKWRKQFEPHTAPSEAMSELLGVCTSGSVRMRGTRRQPNPFWPSDRIIAVRFRQQDETFIPAGELADLYFALDEDNYQGGQLRWKSSRGIAWWPVYFAGDDLVRAWLAHLSATPSPGSTVKTIAAESRCRHWLTELMRNGSPSKSRSLYQAEAIKKFGVGARSFARAWENAVKETGNKGWSKPGRKSSRRIDTPIKS
jgi:hypothetical protein